jgi:hypothetical protein
MRVQEPAPDERYQRIKAAAVAHLRTLLPELQADERQRAA